MRLFYSRHNKPFLIVLALAAVAICLPVCFMKAGAPLPISLGVSFFISRTMFAFVGPTVRNWRLTGVHRGPLR